MPDQPKPPAGAVEAAEAAPTDEAMAAARHICGILVLAGAFKREPPEADIIQMARDIAEKTRLAEKEAALHCAIDIIDEQEMVAIDSGREIDAQLLQSVSRKARAALGPKEAPPMPCGHPRSEVVSGDESPPYCAACLRKAKGEKGGD